jgi:hypothetical protein
MPVPPEGIVDRIERQIRVRPQVVFDRLEASQDGKEVRRLGLALLAFSFDGRILLEDIIGRTRLVLRAGADTLISW